MLSIQTVNSHTNGGATPTYNLCFYFKWGFNNMFKKKFLQKFFTFVFLFNLSSAPIWASSEEAEMKDLTGSVPKVAVTTTVADPEEDPDEQNPSTSTDLGTAAEPEAPGMKFKLGFEFQEISGLCPWALTSFHDQKKPLFSVSSLLSFPKENK